MTQSPPRIVTLSEIEEVVSTDAFALRLIDAIRDGYVASSSGKFHAPPIQTLGAPPMAPFGGPSSTGNDGDDDEEEDGNERANDYSAQTCVKSGYLSSSSHYVIKVASGGYPFPSNSGNVQLYSQYTGRLVALLLDDGLLTELRTAAAGAVAARLFMPRNLLPTLASSVSENDSDDEDSRICIGMVGTGVQARYQLRYLRYVTHCRRVCVWGRTESNVTKFVEDMKGEGWDVSAVNDIDDLLDTCGIVVTTTSSRSPLLGGRWLVESYAPGDDEDDDMRSSGRCRASRNRRRRPLHVTCVGSDATGKKELFDDFIVMADMLIADSKVQTSERGEFEDVLRRGMVKIEDVVEIGELTGGGRRMRSRRVGNDGEGQDDGLTIFDSSGMAVQDCVIASLVYEALQQRNDGSR
jgi:ornithine cyclodeaminase